MPLLSRDEILQADDLTYQDVEVSEWGGTVRVKMLSGTERDAYEQSMISIRVDNNGRRTVRQDSTNARAKLVARCLIDEDGQRLFADKEVVQLGQKSAAALNRVFEVAAALNGLTESDVEELTENFTPGQNGDSTSD